MPRRAVVLTFDRLHLGYLGCYGNDWVETPNLDRLATEAAVFDRHFAENIDPAATNHAWWTGRCQCLLEPEAQGDLPAFVDRLPPEIKSWIFVETDGDDGHFVAPRFEEIVSVRGLDSLDASDDESPFARLVQKVAESLPQMMSQARPGLLWIKSRGVPVPWLPPRDFAELYLDEFGLKGIADDEGDERNDVDTVIERKYAKALYAAYVSWLDRWFGKLWRSLERQPGWDETLFIVTGAAGQSLGEHGALGKGPLLVREEFVHTPLFVRIPDRRHDATRLGALVQPVDLPVTILDWFGLGTPVEGEFRKENAGPATVRGEAVTADVAIEQRAIGIGAVGQSVLSLVRGERDTLRDKAVSYSGAEWGLRTDDFLYVEPTASISEPDHAAGLLFEKPHDRWDQADLSSQHPQIVEELRGELRAIIRRDA